MCHKPGFAGKDKNRLPKVQILLLRRTTGNIESWCYWVWESFFLGSYGWGYCESVSAAPFTLLYQSLILKQYQVNF